MVPFISTLQTMMATSSSSASFQAIQHTKPMSTKPNNGGPAFSLPESENFTAQYGMSLRDWFAGQALNGIIAHPGMEPDDASKTGCAVLAYEYADAMIAERNKQ